jgi:uncharacterized protein YbjT (DUF2867 family)
MKDDSRNVLVTGVTGYLGARLVPRLLEDGHTVRVLTRDAGKLADSEWRDRVQVVEGDATSYDDLRPALEGTDVAFYLLHSMDGRPGFVERDRGMAATFARAAEDAGTGRIVYMSGLHPDHEELSPHLASRVEVGDIFLASRVPAVVLQAAVVLGPGSASYEMLRHLTKRLPVMLAPKWLNNRIQPIAVGDVMHYLTAAIGLPEDTNRTFDVGGPDVLTYREMILRFARVAGLGRRVVVTVPVLTPGLASLWVGLVTPISSGLARPLVGSLVHEVVCREHDLDDLVGPPPGGARGYDESIAVAVTGNDP